MSRFIKQAQRLAFEEVPETCPTVADILGVLAEKYDISDEDIEFTRKLITRLATGRLRDALIGNIAHFLAARQEIKELRKQLPDVPILPKKPRKKKQTAPDNA